jgi:hypothetical protein
MTLNTQDSYKSRNFGHFFLIRLLGGSEKNTFFLVRLKRVSYSVHTWVKKVKFWWTKIEDKSSSTKPMQKRLQTNSNTCINNYIYHLRTIYKCRYIRYEKVFAKMKSNLGTTTTLGTLKLWPLFTSGRCSEVP